MTNLTEQLRHWLTLSATGLLLLLLTGTFLYQINAIFTLLQDKSFRTLTPASTTISSIKKSSIAESHLFGSHENFSSVETRTQWTLRGIILGSKAENNLAIIASSDTDERIYRPGDQLTDGTEIVSILSDRVVLTHNGAPETLLISWDTKNQPALLNTPTRSGKPFTLMKEPSTP